MSEIRTIQSEIMRIICPDIKTDAVPYKIDTDEQKHQFGMYLEVRDLLVSNGII